MTGRIFDGKTSRARQVRVGHLGGGLRLEIEEGPPEFWAWTELPRSYLTVTGDKVLVRRGTQTLEVADKGFYEELRQAYPQAALFRSPFRTWISTPTWFTVTVGTAVAALALAFFLLVPWAGDLIASSLPAEVETLAGAFLLSYLLSDPTGITGAVLGNVDTLRNLQFSREMEAEADAWAAKALEGKADVRALGTLLRRIEVIPVPSWATFLTNHPATGDRAASWNAAPSPGKASPQLQRLFEEIQAELTQ